MSKTNTKANINANIKTNGNQSITGSILNSVLNTMVDDYAEQTKVTELESQVSELVVNKIEPIKYTTNDFTHSAYANADGGVGTSVSIQNWGSDSFAYIKIPVKNGDKYTITTQGGNGARAYALTNSSNVIYQSTGANVNLNSYEVTATQNGYLYVNCKSSGYSALSVLGRNPIVDTCNDIVVAELTTNNLSHSAYCNYESSTNSLSIVGWASDAFAWGKVELIKGDVATITTKGGNNARAYAFADSNGVVKSVASPSATLNNFKFVADEDGILYFNCTSAGYSTFAVSVKRTFISRFESVEEKVNNDLGFCPNQYNNDLPKHPMSLRILLVGNSFIDQPMLALTAYLNALNFDNVVVGKVIYASCSLQKYYTDMNNNSAIFGFAVSRNGSAFVSVSESATLKQCFSYDYWDVITFQQNSANSGMWDTISPYLGGLIQGARTYCKNAGVKIGWQQTWAYANGYSGLSAYGNSQTKMYEAIVDCSKRVVDKFGVDIVIPNGVVMQNLRSISDDFWDAEGHLLGIKGDGGNKVEASATSGTGYGSGDFTVDGLHPMPLAIYALCGTFVQLLICSCFDKTIKGTTASYGWSSVYGQIARQCVLKAIGSRYNTSTINEAEPEPQVTELSGYATSKDNINSEIAEINENLTSLESEVDELKVDLKNVIYIKHYGRSWLDYNDWALGDYFYNAYAKELSRCIHLPVSTGADIEVCEIRNDVLYVYNQDIYRLVNGGLSPIKNVINIRRFGTSWLAYNDWVLGDYFYNTSNKELSKCVRVPVSTGNDIEVCEKRSDVLYVYNNEIYRLINGELGKTISKPNYGTLEASIQLSTLDNSAINRTDKTIVSNSSWLTCYFQCKKDSTYRVIAGWEEDFQRYGVFGITSSVPAVGSALISDSLVVDYDENNVGNNHIAYITSNVNGYIVFQVKKGVTNKSKANELFYDVEANTQNRTFSKVSFANWNMAHYNLGSGIINVLNTDDKYNTYKPIYRKVYSSLNADYISLCEFEAIFRKNDTNKRTSDELLPQFPYYKDNASATTDGNWVAYFSKLPIFNVKEVPFNNYPSGKYRYYLVGDMFLDGRVIKVVSTHLTHDSEHTYAPLQMAQLVEDFSDEQYVVILADFNSSPSDFATLKNNGYSLANCDYDGNIQTYWQNTPYEGCMDNIAVKGGAISNVRVIDCNNISGSAITLSDHKPIVCDVVFF